MVVMAEFSSKRRKVVLVWCGNELLPSSSEGVREWKGMNLVLGF